MHRSPLSIAYAVAAASLVGCAVPASAAPDLAEAEQLFAEAELICERDGGKLWGDSLCGPILLVDYRDRSVVANQPDREGNLRPNGAVYRGTLPDSVIIANTPTEWAGVRWTQLIAPTPTDTAPRHVLLAHELFHRIQSDLGLTRPEAGNQHLDTLEGRYLMQLEWRALGRALQATTKPDRLLAVADALAFRSERYRLFPSAAADEGALEINEGVPEYTGVKLGQRTLREQTAFAIHDLSAFVDAPTFVRSFAYASGPALGLLLDEADPEWKSKLGSGKRLDELLADALDLPTSSGETVVQRAARYDSGALRESEVRRDEQRRARLTAFKARLVDGPVLILPLNKSRVQFNPQTLVPLEGYGTIYPTMQLVDDWGSLEVEHGGALMRGEPRQATVTAVGSDPAGTIGDGWRLTLAPGFRLRAGERPGDLVVVRTDVSE